MNNMTISTPETEGARRATGVSGVDSQNQISRPMEARVNLPDPEVSQHAKRRRFSAEYKLNVLCQADAAGSEPGGIAALLRREGLYASHLTAWRRQRDAGSRQALKPKSRGRKPAPKNPLTAEVERLQKENQRLKHRLKKAEIIIDVQKKVSEMLGIPLDSPERSENE